MVTSMVIKINSTAQENNYSLQCHVHGEICGQSKGQSPCAQLCLLELLTSNETFAISSLYMDSVLTSLKKYWSAKL
jgi:hypothetical protein